MRNVFALFNEPETVETLAEMFEVHPKDLRVVAVGTEPAMSGRKKVTVTVEITGH